MKFIIFTLATVLQLSASASDESVKIIVSDKRAEEIFKLLSVPTVYAGPGTMKKKRALEFAVSADSQIEVSG